MTKSKRVVAILTLAIVMTSCQTSSLASNKDGVVSGDPSRVFADPPAAFDPEAPLVSPGAAALGILAGWEPDAAALQGEVEAAERAAFEAGMADLSKQAVISLELPSPATLGARMRLASPIPGLSIPVRIHASQRLDGPLDTGHDASLMVAMVTGMDNILTSDNPVSGNMSTSETTQEGTTAVTMNAEIGRSADGSSKFGIGFQSESPENGSTTTDAAAHVDGQRCPNAEGQVSFTVKVRLGANSNGSGFTQDLTAFVRAVVDDNAQIATTTIDVTQGTQQTKNGRTVYIESGQTVKYTADDMTSLKISNLHMSQHTDNATPADVSDITGSGHDAAFSAGRTALLISRDNWQGGGCVRIEAASPGQVVPNSETAIAVEVKHKFDGSSVPSKLKAALTGDTSLAPVSLAKTPGTLTYTAPGEAGKSAVITLTATSRRGITTLKLDASTGGAAYRIVGGLDDWQTNTTVCDIMKPFTLTGAGITMQFTGGLSGTYSYTGPYQMAGEGTYTISLPEGPGKPGSMTGGGSGSAMGKTGSGTENYTLTPLDAAGGCSQ